MKQFVTAVENWRTGKAAPTAAVQDTAKRLKDQMEMEQRAVEDRLTSEREAALSRIAEVRFW
jgi:hypothetical protein